MIVGGSKANVQSKCMCVCTLLSGSEFRRCIVSTIRGRRRKKERNTNEKKKTKNHHQMIISSLSMIQYTIVF